jgi:HK97 family phage portal protein
MSFISKLNPFQKIIIGRDKEFVTALVNNIGGNHNKYSDEYAEIISTVFTCVKILGETIGRMGVGVYSDDPALGKQKDKDHYLYDIIHYNPNTYTTSYSFFNALEVIRNLKGNSFARIFRKANQGLVDYLEIISPSRVLGYKLVNNELFYRVSKVDKPEDFDTVPASDMLHFRMITKDGIMGMNPIEALRLNLSTTWEGMSTIDEFYKASGVNPKVIKSTVAGANQKQMLEALDVLKEKYGGSKGAGDLFPLPPNTEIQELQMNAIDAAFLNMIQFNDNKIAALYGIPSHMVGNQTASKYNDIEQTQLGFKSNTVSAISRMYRQEMEYKLLTTAERKAGKSIEFNLMALIETDHRNRLEGYRILANIGAITPNKIARLEGLDTYQGGDDHYIQSNMMSVEKYTTKQTTKSQNQ